MAVDHDQRFKILLKEFLREFFELFFPDWVEYFDFAAVEWLDKEVFTDPPAGSRRFLDMVAKIKLKKPLPVPRHNKRSGVSHDKEFTRHPRGEGGRRAGRGASGTRCASFWRRSSVP